MLVRRERQRALSPLGRTEDSHLQALHQKQSVQAPQACQPPEPGGGSPSLGSSVTLAPADCNLQQAQVPPHT